jgi:hypothetical protein
MVVPACSKLAQKNITKNAIINITFNLSLSMASNLFNLEKPMIIKIIIDIKNNTKPTDMLYPMHVCGKK